MQESQKSVAEYEHWKPDYIYIQYCGVVKSLSFSPDDITEQQRW